MTRVLGVSCTNGGDRGKTRLGTTIGHRGGSREVRTERESGREVAFGARGEADGREVFLVGEGPADVDMVGKGGLR